MDRQPYAHDADIRMDDVEDNSELRRGIPVSHLIYGVPQTINTANYVYFLAMQELIQMEGPKGGLMGAVTGTSCSLYPPGLGRAFPAYYARFERSADGRGTA